MKEPKTIILDNVTPNGYLKKLVQRNVPVLIGDKKTTTDIYVMTSVVPVPQTSLPTWSFNININDL